MNRWQPTGRVELVGRREDCDLVGLVPATGRSALGVRADEGELLAGQVLGGGQTVLQLGVAPAEAERREQVLGALVRHGADCMTASSGRHLWTGGRETVNGAWFRSGAAGIPSHVEKRAIDPRTERRVGAESPSQARMHRRLGGRLPLGGLLGAIAGAMVGALVGFLFFDRSAAVLASILASAVFGLGVGMLVAGYSSLESPDPGAEPSDTARPIADRPEVVREEHPDTPAPN
jgi:hypothetical protein